MHKHYNTEDLKQNKYKMKNQYRVYTHKTQQSLTTTGLKGWWGYTVCSKVFGRAMFSIIVQNFY